MSSSLPASKKLFFVITLKVLRRPEKAVKAGHQNFCQTLSCSKLGFRGTVPLFKTLTSKVFILAQTMKQWKISATITSSGSESGSCFRLSGGHLASAEVPLTHKIENFKRADPFDKVFSFISREISECVSYASPRFHPSHSFRVTRVSHFGLSNTALASHRV